MTLGQRCLRDLKGLLLNNIDCRKFSFHVGALKIDCWQPIEKSEILSNEQCWAQGGVLPISPTSAQGPHNRDSPIVSSADGPSQPAIICEGHVAVNTVL